MTDQERKAMEMALEALERSMEAGLTGIKVDEAIIALRQALQRPVKSYTNNSPQYATDDRYTKQQNVYTSAERVHESDKSVHDLRKVAEMALQALCSANPIGHALEDYAYHNKATEALRQALAQPEQEPVMEVQHFGEKQVFVLLKPLSDGAKLYTAPVSKPWVSLTEEESSDIYNAHHNTYGECVTSAHDLVLDIEAKLKEKNNG